MDISFENRAVIITGSGRGLGRDYAMAFAARGAKVLVNDIGASLDGKGSDASCAAAVADEIQAAGGEAAVNTDSVTAPGGGARIVEAAMDTFGRVDVLVSNAGILRDRSFLKMTESEWDDVIDVHLKGAFAVTKSALARMKSAGYGRIVLTSSVSGLFGAFGQTNYGAAKLGIVGLMNCLKIETAKYDINVNAVAPTGTTRMTEALYDEQTRARLAPTLNAPLVLYLSSSENTESGMIFCAKGGWYARAAVVCAPGIAFEPNTAVTPEMLRDRFAEITNLTDAQPLESGAQTLDFMKP